MTDFWKGLLDQAREGTSKLKETNETNNQETLLSLCSHVHDVYDLIQTYMQTITEQRDNHNEAKSLSNSTKILIVDCRRALRFLLCLLSVDAEITRQNVQCVGTGVSSKVSLHERSLSNKLSTLIAHEACDRKCRLIAAKVLCNLGTSNEVTASHILQNIKTSPSDDDAWTTLSLKTAMNEDEDESENDSHDPIDTCPISREASTWFEMVHGAGSKADRSALAAIIAALYNCMTAVEGNRTVFIHVAMTISNDRMLACNLMRYILPANVIQRDGGQTSNDFPTSTNMNNHSDDATDWVIRLIEKLCTYGMLPSLYNSLGSRTGVTPEQLILLHCVGSVVEEYAENLNTKHSRGLNPLGGACEEEKLIITYEFLASQWITLRQNIKDRHTNEKLGVEDERYPGELACIDDASNVIIDMLSSGTAIDGDNNSEEMSNARIHLGRRTCLLQEALLDLGLLVDRLGIENRGINARELKISDSDKHLVTSIVRMIGNVCFRCKENQDMVRCQNIPVPRVNVPHVEEYSPQSSRNSDEDQNVRNGLHVLLSCTSFAYGCFTLREWAIIAIHNILEGNAENQKVVEELEAQQALQTPELQKLGVKVNLDKRGQVQVSQASTDKK